jgi:hypothetical protein
MIFMADRPFEPMERDAAPKIESVLNDLAKDCDELTAESARGKIDGVHHGISAVRELTVALKSLLNVLNSRH